MDKSKAPAPDKDKPHPFQAAPEVPAVYPRSGAMLQETGTTDGEAVHYPSAPNCTLCGAPENEQIHIVGKAQADAEPLHWE